VDKRRFQFCDFATLYQISSYGNKMLLIEKWRCTSKVGPAFQSIQPLGGHQAGLCHAF